MPTDVSFVRKHFVEQQEPPARERGVVKWIRENLFSGPVNTILTLLALYFIVRIVVGVWPWFANGVWGTSTLAECREILQGVNAACFSVLQERGNQMLFGIAYPADQYWRPIVAFVLLFVCAAPVLFSKLPRNLLVASALYPFLAYWLIWGGTIMISVMALVGFAVGYLVFSRVEKAQGFATAFFTSIIAAVVVWWAGGFVSSAMANFIALEAIPSRDMGGFMLNMILGTICVSLSLPLGIVLALGRQSNMPIIKGICVVFIEFVRGVPLITLLFVANVVLAYFFPPGTNLDLILRVIIMITMFSAAYIAEVIRGGLAALPRGQYEAADSLGLDYAQATRLIIMPQALKISIPGIVNVAVGLFKDTTLVSVISMFDLVGAIRGPILGSTDWTG
ncbi:MAG: amino acid ABC transporter permease, partial [Pseudomonadota bacterium]